MKTRHFLSVAVVMLVLVGTVQAMSVQTDVFGTGANAFEIDFVTISGANNPTSGYGIVNNDYRMGVYEITNDQWDKFKAAYGTVTGNPSVAYNQGSSFSTDVAANGASWYEGAQFVNWLNTSTGHQAAYKFTGTQGTGNYALDIWSVVEASGGTNLYRHKDAFYFLPTEDEWVKAAYWNGTSLQAYANASPGDLILGAPDPAKWRYRPNPGSSSWPWNVGSGSEELNGTFDMMGNVWEWMESPYFDSDYGTGSYRVFRGGSCFNDALALWSARRYKSKPELEANGLGFRIASRVPGVVPEPMTATGTVMGIATVLGYLRRRRR